MYAIRLRFTRPAENVRGDRVHSQRPHPRGGYWDGGPKTGGLFAPDRTVHPGSGKTIRWGCFELNYWFNAGSGRSWKEAAAIARNRLEKLTRVPAVITIEKA